MRTPSILRRAIAAGTAAVCAGAGAGLIAAAPAAAANPTYPVVYNGLVGYAHAATPDVPAPGSHYVQWNDTSLAASCHSEAHPDPVVLVGGTLVNQAGDFNAVAPLLADNGYCVYTSNFGSSPGDYIGQIGDIPTSATELATVVDKVRAATGAAKVDIVGHSQGGGVLPRWYLKYDGGAQKVSVLVGLAPSNHGTTLSGLFALDQEYDSIGFLHELFTITDFPAAYEQEEGSTVNTELDSGGDTVPGVSYTNIVSEHDEVVTPYTNQFLTAGPGATVHNILLQNVCAQDDGEHLSVVYDQVALRLMLNALDPAAAVAPTCVPIAPVVGG